MTIKRFLGEEVLSADAIDVSGYGALQITDLLTSPSTASHRRGVGIVSHSERTLGSFGQYLCNFLGMFAFDSVSEHDSKGYSGGPTGN
jgi:hypothetical protein